MSKISPVPKEFHTVTPHIVVRDSAGAIDFYKRAFAATEISRTQMGPGGPIVHAEVRIGDSIVMLNDEMEGQSAPKGPSPVTLSLYVPDADATFASATKAGAQPVMPLANMFWGDRYGVVVDPFGHSWAIATHIEDVPADELQKRMAAMAR
jgi:PhnB protein